MLSLSLLVFLYLPCKVSSYATIHNSNLNSGDLIGIWRLTGERSLLPFIQDPTTIRSSVLKEFTVYPPKKKKIQHKFLDEGTFIRLSANGSFEQCATLDAEEEDREEADQINSKNENSRKKIVSIFGLSLMKGTWDYIDGKLILATDRPSDCDGARKVHDTILEGEVVATTEQSLHDNPVLSNTTSKANQTISGEETVYSEDKNVDVYLSVPKGSVQVGKFMYPKRHPSFFEQPIFQPTPAGSFHLRQVLGNLNTRYAKDDEDVERFRREDFYGKRFFLTSRPLQNMRKGKLRWNRSIGRYVEDKPKADPDEKIDIRVMQIDFFSNNTFSTVEGGLMNEKTKILRGKWSIIGREKDHLWMQVSRFGFGRSVSGSVYSEGSLLTQDDQRSYWGMIREIDDEKVDKESNIIELGEVAEKKKKLEISGSVLFGWGLEPEPIGKFTMMEQTEDKEDAGDDDYEDVVDDNYEDDDEDDILFESVFE